MRFSGKPPGPVKGGRIAMENNRGVIHPASPGPAVLAAILFGILDHGGTAIDVSTHVPREIVLVQPARD
jgi:hypothetical protein